MKIYDVDPYLRRNPKGVGRHGGSYRLRFYFSADKKKKAERIEIGLGTSRKREARIRASALIRSLYAMGYSIASKIKLKKEKKTKEIYPPKKYFQMELDLH